MRVTLIGAIQAVIYCDPDEPVSIGNNNPETDCVFPPYSEILQDLKNWADTTGARPLSVPVYDENGEPTGAMRSLCAISEDEHPIKPNGTIKTIIRQECMTFHQFELVRPVEIRHVRYWVNVGSRVLGPGTDYSMTLSWNEGVALTNGFEFNSTVGHTSISEQSYKNCTSESFKFSASQGLSLFEGILDLGFNEETTTGEEECYTGKNAEQTSTTLSRTFSDVRTVTRDSTVSETTSVTAAVGADRVYTVWQLVDRYIFVDPDGTTIDPADLLMDHGYTQGLGATEIPELTPKYLEEHGWDPEIFYFEDGSVRFIGTWKPIAVSWPTDGRLDDRTQLFIQQTMDFPHEGSLVLDSPPVLKVIDY